MTCFSLDFFLFHQDGICYILFFLRWSLIKGREQGSVEVVISRNLFLLKMEGEVELGSCVFI